MICLYIKKKLIKQHGIFVPFFVLFDTEKKSTFYKMIRTNNSIFNYLSVSEKDKDWGLYLTGGGTADVPPHTPYPPTKHPDAYMFHWKSGRILHEYQIIYITRGAGTFESESVGQKQISEGTVFILLPEMWHRYTPNTNTGWKEYWISFNGKQADKFLATGIFSKTKPVLDIGLNEEIIKLYQKILDLLESEKVGYKEICAAIVYQIIAQVMASERSKMFEGKEIETIINKSKVLMADRIESHIYFNELANELGIGYSWYRRMFFRYTGITPAQYFLQLKLNRAKDLLMNTSMSIKEIALKVGFDSQFYFSKFFTQRMGISPKKLRDYSRGEKKQTTKKN